ncbi:uncharacterized protein F4812DRAFT_435736 [Daldinia caldariorum]|uniref:uncharacterized protein n=1 Tax=Daldinia caldariorum TaxID=326644 RepID=UPI0020075D84|nr:uncharacterized protein F4812DRAFT_435736 [Daldinia caldariorum]KAI1466052.1 hypothetical protein F4812DRAFT_435736 [Daldinia caldariorum]
MRKREQDRIRQESKKKRTYQEHSEDNSSESDTDTINGNPVPEWLRNKCRPGYSTAEIYELVDRMRREIIEEKRCDFPDIEILPNITKGPSVGRKTRALPRRRKNTSSHTRKRSQSVGTALQPGTDQMIRRVSQPTHLGAEGYTQQSPNEKRRRMSGTSPHGDHASIMNSRLPEGPASILAPVPMQPQLHRQIFDNTQENRDEHSYYYRRGANNNPDYGYDRRPGPASQPGEIQPIGATPGSNRPQGYVNDRQFSHQRSFSDMDTNGPRFSFGPSVPSSYPPIPQHQVPEQVPYDTNTTEQARYQTASFPCSSDGRPVPGQRSVDIFSPSLLTSRPSQPPSQPPFHHQGYQQGYHQGHLQGHPPPNPTHGHTRHQSIPSIGYATGTRLPINENEHGNMARPQGSMIDSPSYHPHGWPYSRPQQHSENPDNARLGERR